MLASIAAIVTAIVVPACAIWGGFLPGNEMELSGRFAQAPTPVPGDSLLFASAGATGPRRFADLVAADLKPNADGKYDMADYSERMKNRPSASRSLAVGSPTGFYVGFTLANGKDGYRTVVPQIDLTVDSFTPVAAEIPLGCIYGGQGGNGSEKIVKFEGVVDSTDVGREYPLKLDTAADTVVTLMADDLEVFHGSVYFVQPGEYIVKLVVHFADSSGRSGVITSRSMNLIIVPEEKARYFRPADPMFDRYPCP